MKTTLTLYIAAIILIVASFSVMFHQWIVWGTLWSFDQSTGIHHETIFITLLSFGIGMLVTIGLVSKKLKM